MFFVSTHFRAHGYAPAMIRRACLSALLAAAACASADQTPQPLDEEQVRSSEFAEGFSVPSPGELFAAFDKIGKPDWAAFARKQGPTHHTSRPLIALNLGVRLADGFLAVETQDRQQVKNIVTEIKLLAKILGLEQEFMGRSNSITAFADNRQWDALNEELEAVQSEISSVMGGRRDEDLATLMLLGSWLHSVEIASAVVSTGYTIEGAKILRQPAIGGVFAARLAAMPYKFRIVVPIAEIQVRLPQLEAALSFPAREPPTADAAASLHKLASGMVAFITAPEK